MTNLVWIGFRAICEQDVGCFGKLGVRTTLFARFEDGLAEVVRNPPDVVVLSLSADSSKLATQIRAIRQVAPTTFVAAYVGETHHVQLALVAGADDAVSLEATGALPCFPTMKWLEAGKRGDGAPAQLARRAAYLERKVEALQSQLASAEAHAIHDASSGLLGRGSMLTHIEQALAMTNRLRTSGLLCVAELGGFEAATDILGEWIVGGVVQHLGRSLAEKTRASDVVARVAPTRFAVLMPIAKVTAANAIVTRLRDGLAEVPLPRNQRLKPRLAIAPFGENHPVDATHTLQALECELAPDGRIHRRRAAAG